MRNMDPRFAHVFNRSVIPAISRDDCMDPDLLEDFMEWHTSKLDDGIYRQAGHPKVRQIVHVNEERVALIEGDCYHALEDGESLIFLDEKFYVVPDALLTPWSEDWCGTEIQFAHVDFERGVTGGSNVMLSGKAHKGYHTVFLDLDMGSSVINRSNSGPSHVNLGRLPWVDYLELLTLLDKLRLIETRWVNAAKEQGFATLRTPWETKMDGGYINDPTRFSIPKVCDETDPYVDTNRPSESTEHKSTKPEISVRLKF